MGGRKKNSNGQWVPIFEPTDPTFDAVVRRLDGEEEEPEGWLDGFLEWLADDPKLCAFAEALSGGCHKTEAARLSGVGRPDAAIIRLRQRFMRFLES